jgi:hypothetical protein
MTGAAGAEVGSGHVSIFPVMTGFRSLVSKEIQASGKEGGSIFSRAFQGVGSKAGSSLGKDMKSAFNGTAGDLASPALKKMQSEVASAARTMSAARLKQQDAAGKVRVAEAQLAAAIAKNGAESVQAVAASERLASAKRKEQSTSDALTTANKRLADAKKAVADVKQATIEAPKTGVFTSAVERIKSTLSGLNSVRLNGASSTVNSFGGTMEKASSRIKASTVAIGSLIASGVRSVVNYGRSAIEAYNTASAATAKFQQIASNNKWSQEQINGLLSLNKNLGKTGVISAGTLKAAQAQLGTFALSAGSIKTLTPALSDLIANQKGYNASSEDGVTLANLLGKVMTGSASALKKYGVTLSDNQAKLIKNGTESQRAATAAQVLEQNFGGVNKALAATPYGKYVVMQHQLAAIKTTIGSGFIDAIGSLGDMGVNVVDKVNGKLDSFFKWLPKAVGGSVALMKTGKVSDAFKEAFNVPDSVSKSIESSIEHIKSSVKGLIGFVKTGSFSDEFNKGFKGVDTKTVNDLKKSLSGVRDQILGTTKTINPLTGKMGGSVSTMGLVTRGIQTVTTSLNILKPVLSVLSNMAKVFSELPGPVQGALGTTVLFGSKLGGLITPIGMVVKASSTLTKGIGSVGSAISGMVSGRLSKASSISSIAESLESAGSSASTAAPKIGNAAASVEKLDTKAAGAVKKTGGLSSALGGISPASVAFGAAGIGISLVLAGIADDAEKSGDTIEDFTAAVKEGGSATESFFKGLQTGSEGKLGLWDKFNSGQGVFTDGTLAKAAKNAGISFDTVQQAISGSSSAMQALNDKTGNLWNQMSSSGSAAKIVRDEVNGLRDAYKNTIDQMIEYSKTQDSITAGFGSASAKFSELSTTLKANGDNLQNNSQLSQQSSQYMQSAASSALEAAKAQVVYGKANGDTAGSVQEAKNQIQSMRDQLVGTLTQYGMSEDAANKYADALGLIPGNVNTDAFLQTDVASSDLTAYLDRLQATPEQKQTVMNALTAQADGNVDNLHLKISDLPTWVNSVLTADNTDAQKKTAEATTSLRHFDGSKANASLNADNSDVKNKASEASGSIRSVPEEHKTNFFAEQAGSGWTNIKNFFGSFGSTMKSYWGLSHGGEVHRANGGIVQRLASGGPSGFVSGPGTSTSDSIMTWLSDGEYVIRAAAARKIGLQNLNRANATGKLSGGTVISSQPVVNQNISITNKGVVNPYVNGNIMGRTVASSARASLMGV